MISNIAELFSILLVLAYFYKKTKNKIPLWILRYSAFLIACIILFRKLFPEIPFVSPTYEYMGFLFVTGVPFLILIVLIGIEVEKQRTMTTEDSKPIILFKATKENIIFWTVIVLINLAAFIVDKSK